MSLLTIGGEWWPSAKKASVRFGSVADLTIRKLYTDAAVSKQPRLVSASNTEPTVRTASGDAEPAQSPSMHQVETDRDTLLHPFGWVDGIIDPALQQGGAATTTGWSTFTGSTLDAETEPPNSLSYRIGMDQNYTPEIENFFAQFGRTDFSWTFRLGDEPEPDPGPGLFDAPF